MAHCDSRPTATGWWCDIALRLRTLALVALLPVLLAACGGTWQTDYGEPIDASVSQGWRVSQIKVTVPDTLTVSDENIYYPNTDIVWHGDPPGDRRAQVQAIVSDAARRATSGLRGSRPVALDLTVSEFHGVTPITLTRAPEAVHNIAFTAQILDARSGAALIAPTVIKADLPAIVGGAGIYAERYGPTQKQQVSAHIEAVIKGWLGIGPDMRRSFSGFGR